MGALSQAEAVSEVPVTSLLCHYNTLLHARQDEDSISFEREMPPLCAATTDSWLATRRAEGFWQGDKNEELSATGYPVMVPHSSAWTGAEAWVERLRIIEWRLWLGPSEVAAISDHFVEQGLEMRSSERATSCYWQEGPPMMCELCKQATSEKARRVAGEEKEIEEWLDRELERIRTSPQNSPSHSPQQQGKPGDKLNLESDFMPDEEIGNTLSSGEYYDHVGGVFWPAKFSHEVAVHHVRPTRRFYRFVREYDFHAVAPNSQVRTLLGSPLEECRPGVFTVVGTLQVSVQTSRGNVFQMKVHPDDTIHEVVTLRLPRTLVPGAVLSWNGRDLNRGATVSECAFFAATGCTLLLHRFDFLLEMDTVLRLSSGS